MDYKVFIFLFISFCVSCRQDTQKMNVEKSTTDIFIDSLFIQFDIDFFEQNRTDKSYRFQTPDSLFFIIQGEQTLERGFYQIVYSLKDSLFYDEYFYFPNGKLQKKSRYIRHHQTPVEAYYEFDNDGKLITFIEYEKSKSMDILHLIALVKQLGYNFFSPQISFYINYTKNEDFSKNNFIHSKYCDPFWCFDITNYDNTMYFIRINANTNKIETECFWDGENMHCKKGDRKDL